MLGGLKPSILDQSNNNEDNVKILGASVEAFDNLE
jgi:hypothetical protein